jgi:hypothetical protein
VLGSEQSSVTSSPTVGARRFHMRLGRVRAHFALLSAVAVLLGLLLFVVYWLDHPFGNQLGVTSAPFEQSLSVFDSIDRGDVISCVTQSEPERDSQSELEFHVDAGRR